MNAGEPLVLIAEAFGGTVTEVDDSFSGIRVVVTGEWPPVVDTHDDFPAILQIGDFDVNR